MTSIVSCSENNAFDNVSDSDYAKKNKQDELMLYAAYPNVIDYKTARYLAYQELAGGVDQFVKLPAEYELAKTPRVIYDYDNFPKYYEFDVLSGS